MEKISEVIGCFDQNKERHLKTLKDLVRIPSVSFPGFDPGQVHKSADAVAQLFRENGLENVEILGLDSDPECFPYVYGDWLKAEGKPTVLLYAHHDVQPPGREDVWQSPPFEPTEKEGPGGTRLYARGAADDKAGILVHLSAISSYLKSLGELPVNVKVIVEGEEEIGSEHLPEFLSTYREKLDADYMILTDTLNFDAGVPGLTIALRGMIAADIELRSLKNTVHSGMWGGPIPDPAMGLAKMISQLVDDNGQICIPGWDQITPSLTEDEVQFFESLPEDEAHFRRQAGLVDGVEILKEGPSRWAQIWRGASLSVCAIQSSSRAQAGNTINDSAWARVSIRLGPGMKAEEAQKLFLDELHRIVPWGLQLEIKSDLAVDPWMTEPKGPAFEAARRALAQGYGHEAVPIGCGGSIPFVQPFVEALDEAPALLIGVEDPYTNAHGENESLLISDFYKACRSEIYLLNELAML